MPGGRPTKLTKELKERAQEYIVNFADYDHAIPSVVGMAVVLDVAKSSLFLWAQKNKLGFSDILAKCNEAQEFTLINKGLKNEVNPTIAKLALGKHGYSERVENELYGKDGGPIDVGDKELARRLAFVIAKEANVSEEKK